MRSALIIPVLVVTLSCVSTKNTATKSKELSGTWIPIKQEIAGTSIPAGAFEKQTLLIRDSSYTLTAESVDKGIVRYSNDKMDIYGREGVNAGKHFTAIFKREKNRLTICYNLAGDKYPESFDTKGKPRYFLSVFKKEVTKKGVK